jgi:hypothetical protein
LRCGCRAPPRRDDLGRDHADGERAQRHRRHRPDVGHVTAGGSATITVRFLLERDLDDAANSVREKVAGAMRSVPPEVCRRSSRSRIPTPTRS